jgi:C_GCAxxG_C_C family probable redox protein
MIGKPDNMMLKAVTGLEGGCVASGSTCGALTGGALGLALNRDAGILHHGMTAKREVVAQVRNYVKWFKETYGTSLCRERTKTDFHTTSGLIRYLLPGDRIVRCMWHIRGSMRYLYDCCDQKDFSINNPNPIPSETPFHCAEKVLAGIRKKTEIGDLRLERLAFVFDAGVAYTGGLCGALAGAIMAINIMMGLSTRSLSYWNIIKAFTVGHVNLIKKRPMGSPESFMAGRGVVDDFRKSAGSLECRSITGKNFSGWEEFQAYISESKRCASLIQDLITKTSEVIFQYK